MKILVIHNHYQRRGGEDAVFETECAMLETAGHEVVRFEVSNDVIPSGFGKCFFFFKTVWNRKTARAIRETIRREKPDVAHFHNTFPLVSPAAYHACAAEKIPVVQTIHNFRMCCLNAYLLRDGKVCEDCLGRNAWRGVFRKCYRGSFAQSFAVWAMLTFHGLLGTFRRKVRVYIALTEFGRQKMIKAGLPENKIIVKGNTVKLPVPDKTNGRGKYGLLHRHPEPTVLYVGRLSNEKGVSVLVAAWGLCHGNLPQKSRLVIVGDGPEREALEKQAAGFAGVSFAGALPPEQVADWMRRATVLVSPSVCYETFGIAIVEAAAAGLPSIASDLGAFASLIKNGETGFLFPMGDAVALSDTLTRALASPAATRTVGENARRAFLAGESVPERNVVRLLDVYKEVKPKSGS